jgi:hypothetical protein
MGETPSNTLNVHAGPPRTPPSLTHQSVVTFCIVYAITVLVLFAYKGLRVFLKEPVHTYIHFDDNGNPTYTNKFAHSGAQQLSQENEDDNDMNS